MKVLFSILILLLGSASSASQAGNHEEFIPVCGAIVAKKYLPEVKIPNVSDHYQHCSLSCVMTIYCGVMDSFEVGVLKEIYDALGYGTPQHSRSSSGYQWNSFCPKVQRVEHSC
jgi:hypothetical protein